MITYSKTSKAATDRAIAKARSAKPKVAAVAGSVNEYTVTGSKGDSYRVTFGKNEAGEFIADCACKGGKGGRMCYHIAAAAPVFKLAVIRRRDAAALCEDCHTELTGAENGGRLCAHCEAGYVEDVQPAPAPVADQDAQRKAKLARDYADLFGE